MALETALRALEFGAETSDGACGIVFFGGEPLLARDVLAQVVTEGNRETGQGRTAYHFKVTTNGLLLDEGFLNFADRHNMLIAMSFDGLPEAHDKHRRLRVGSPSSGVLLRRLGMLLEARPYASVLSVVNPDTVQYLVQSVEFLAGLGARYMVVSLNYAAQWTEADMQRLEDQCRQLAQVYIRWSREGRKFYLSPFEVKLSTHIKGPDSRHDRCELGQRQLSVDPEGYLYPCVQFTRAGHDSRWCIGHVSTGIEEAARRRLYEESSADRQPCDKCAIRNRCNYTCGCLNWQTTGSLTKVSPVLCRYERMLVPIADHIGETLYREGNTRFIDKHYNPTGPLNSLFEDALLS